jgi:hypothetical protein
MDMLCGAWPPRCSGLLMYTRRRYTNFYIRSEWCLCRLAPGWTRYVLGLSGRGYADLCIFIRHLVPSHAAWRASEAILGALRGTLCNIRKRISENLPSETVWKIRMGPETGVTKASERSRKGSEQPLLAAEVELPRNLRLFFQTVSPRTRVNKNSPRTEQEGEGTLQELQAYQSRSMWVSSASSSVGGLEVSPTEVSSAETPAAPIAATEVSASPITATPVSA